MASKSREIIQVAEESRSHILEAKISDYQDEFDNLAIKYERLEEYMAGLDLQLDNRGWSDAFGIQSDGPDLRQLKDAARQLQNLVAQNVWIKRGLKLRTNFIWDGGIRYDKVPGAARGRGKNVQELIDIPLNQKNFFGRDAHEKRESALYTDHAYYVLGDNSTKQLSVIPQLRISGVYGNPYESSEIWAYRVSRINQSTNKEDRKWYFLNAYTDKMGSASSLKLDSQTDPIDKSKTLFVLDVNKPIGWQFGVPDALSAMAWARQYRDFLISGKKMSDAMAMLWAQIKAASKAGGDNAALAMGGNQGAGGTSINGQEVAPLSTAGKSYNFDAGRPIAAAMATGLELSVINILSDPGAAGSSYGSAQTLDLPTQLAISARREIHIDFDTEILRWMGWSDPAISFQPLTDSTDSYRDVQALLLKWSTGLYGQQEMKDDLEELYGRKATPFAKGAMIPNNSEFPNTLTNDDQTATTTAAAARSDATSIASPTQGKNSVAGAAPQDNSTRTDTLSK